MKPIFVKCIKHSRYRLIFDCCKSQKCPRQKCLKTGHMKLFGHEKAKAFVLKFLNRIKDHLSILGNYKMLIKNDDEHPILIQLSSTKIHFFQLSSK